MKILVITGITCVAVGIGLLIWSMFVSAGNSPTSVTVRDQRLIIKINGWDKIWSVALGLEVPLIHLNSARSAVHDRPCGFRLPGTYLRNVITAGTFRSRGQNVFWDVHNPNKAVAFELRDEKFAKIIVQVRNPAETIALVNEALAATNGRTMSTDLKHPKTE